MEFAKIVLGSIAAAIVYGILHDQVTARICLEYFTVFHPHISGPQTATWLGLAWGVIATWWVGAGLGVCLGIAARVGRLPKMPARPLTPMVGKLLAVMAVCAAVAGLIGYLSEGIPAEYPQMLPEQLHRRFAADFWAQNASYLTGILGGIGLCIHILMRRRAARAS